MPGPKCSVGQCNNNGYKCKLEGKSLAFHRFPKDPGIRHKWIKKCGKSEDFRPDYAFVCSDHFRAEDYKRDMQAELLGYVGRRKLKTNAVPSLKLPFEEEKQLSPAEKEKIEKLKHDKLIQDCLNGSNEYKGILSFEMFKKMKYTKLRNRIQHKTSPGSPVFVFAISPSEFADDYDPTLNDYGVSLSSSEDDLSNFGEHSTIFLNEDFTGENKGETRIFEGRDISNDNPNNLKERIKQLEQKVIFQERIICKLKRGILREKKMMEKVVLATNPGYGSGSSKKRRLQYDEKAKDALLEIYSLDPQSYSRFSKALNLPTKSVLSSWDPQVCPPTQMPTHRNSLGQRESLENDKEEYIIGTPEY